MYGPPSQRYFIAHMLLSWTYLRACTPFDFNLTYSIPPLGPTLALSAWHRLGSPGLALPSDTRRALQHIVGTSVPGFLP